MSRLVKYVMLGAVILFVLNCTKENKNTKENLQNVVDKPVESKEDVVDHQNHDCGVDHGEGNLCLGPVGNKFSSLVMEGKVEEAIDVMLEAKDVPGYQYEAKKIYDSIIYLQDKEKQYDKNIEIWKDGHKKGLVFNINKTEKHFEPYLKLEGFEEVYAKDLEMQKEIEKTK